MSETLWLAFESSYRVYRSKGRELLHTKAMPADRLRRQRFELKDMLHEEQALAIRDFLGAHLEIDESRSSAG